MNREHPKRWYFSAFNSPIGLLSVAVDAEGKVKRLHFGQLDDAGMMPDDRAIKPVRDQVEEYFAGDRKVFDLPLSPEGTVFQRAVWDGLLAIPFGKFLSYGQLAERVGRAGAFRAVGAANGANPIAVIIPCHRVVGSDRSLTGFGGGVPTKAALLALEGVIAQVPPGTVTRRTRIEAQPSLF